ncbi:tetratricopeptide (TPR) repeat protein [Catenulispora sp. MAP12-49]|uniref:tetratricopeptide repeat protein n=1 Tax=Catenulispora sp. MAP12-49 TaxID=3156302 RepID=UPI0035124F28
MPEGERSFQEMLRRRRRAGFIARDAELSQFRINLTLPVDSPDRSFVVSVHGDGGVGKSSLLGQLRRIAMENGAAVATVEDPIFEVPDAMRAIAVDLAGSSPTMGEFLRLYDTYRRRRLEAESDPQAPSGLASFMTRTAVRAGLHAAHAVPGVGGLIQEVDSVTLADQADRLRAFLGTKFRHHDDVQMLMSPLEVLTPPFLAGLTRVGRSRLLALFVDTYEQTGQVLDTWIRAMLEGTYGALPEDLVLTIAGRSPLDYDVWAPYQDVRLDMPLAPFTEAEARHMLASKGIMDERVVEVILAVSGRLPLWLATLADHQPEDPEQVGDSSGKAVERFLKWESDPVRRDMAVAAAFPRTVNEDVIDVLAEEGATSAAERREIYTWLRHQHFVNDTAAGCRYHDVVRAAMLRVERGHSPTRWRRRHEQLAEAHEAWCRRAGVDRAWDDIEWQNHKLEAAYHRLCADPGAALSHALADAVYALIDGPATMSRWVRMLVQAGYDTDSAILSDWGGRLKTTLRGSANQALADAMTLLIGEADLPRAVASCALQTRGRALYLLGDDQGALADFDRALTLDTQDRQAWAYRGDAYRWLRRFDEALADFDKAIELDPDYGWAYASRGETLRRMGRYERALEDFDKALSINPHDSYALASRGETHRRTGRFEQAIADFDQAIAENPVYAWAFGNRAETFIQMGRPEQAVADFDRATTLDPEYAWAIASRGRARAICGEYDLALADFDKALGLKPEYAWAAANRANTLMLMGRLTEAENDFSRAIALNPQYAWALAGRGTTLRRTGRHAEALADIERAIDLQPDADWYQYCAAQVQLCLGDHDSAVVRAHAAIDRVSAAIQTAAEPSARLYFSRALYHAALDHVDQAADSVAEALKLQPPQHEIARTVAELQELLAMMATGSRAVHHLLTLLRRT